MEEIKEKKYIVTKKQEKDVLTSKQYAKLKGLSFQPKKTLNIDNMIKINKMVIINPSLIKTLVSRKSNIAIEKLIKLLSAIYDDDEDPGTTHGVCSLVLDEEEKFRNILMNKYKEYLEEKEYKKILKKLEIIKSEVLLRQKALYEDYYAEENEEKGKGGR